jgi:hypothetical protein
LSEQGEEKAPDTTSCEEPVKWNSSVSPIAAVTLSGVKDRPEAPTWTVCVGEEEEATVLAADMEEVDEPLESPYWARAGAAARAERRRVESILMGLVGGLGIMCLLIGGR